MRKSRGFVVMKRGRMLSCYSSYSREVMSRHPLRPTPTGPTSDEERYHGVAGRRRRGPSRRVVTPVDATTRRCADDVELSCAPLSLHRGSSETACRAASRSARQAVAKQLDRQENGVSLRDALVAKSRRALATLRAESEASSSPQQPDDDETKPPLLNDHSDAESDESDDDAAEERPVVPCGLLDDDVAEEVLEDDQTVQSVDPCPWWVPLVAAPEVDRPRSAKLRRNHRAELASAFLAASLRCCASRQVALTSSERRFPPAFLLRCATPSATAICRRGRDGRRGALYGGCAVARPASTGRVGTRISLPAFHAVADGFVNDPTRGRARVRVCGALRTFSDTVIKSSTFTSPPLEDLLCETGHRFQHMMMRTWS